MRRFHPRAVAFGVCALLLTTSFVPQGAASREAPPTVLYRLGGESAFVSGCIVGLCLCPVRQTYMAGTFGLTRVPDRVGPRTFSVTDIDWFTHARGAPWNEITGSGNYFVGAESHRIVLDLQVDGGAPIHVDSGDVPYGGGFPAIDIGGLTDTACFQEGVEIVAAPATSSIQVSMAEPSTISWTGDPLASAYDVVAGDLMLLRAAGGDFTVAGAVCVANDVAGTGLASAAPVAQGHAVWFLVRGQPEPGYDSGGAGQVAPRDGRIDACP